MEGLHLICVLDLDYHTLSTNQFFVAFGFSVVVVVFEVTFAFGGQYACEVVLPYLNFGYERRFDCTIPTPNGLI